MKSESLSRAATRTSRLIAFATLAASVGVLIGHRYDAAALTPYLAVMMSPPSALCALLLSLAALMLSTVSGSAFAAKAQDPDDNGYVCFVLVGMVICVPSR